MLCRGTDAPREGTHRRPSALQAIKEARQEVELPLEGDVRDVKEEGIRVQEVGAQEEGSSGGGSVLGKRVEEGGDKEMRLDGGESRVLGGGEEEEEEPARKRTNRAASEEQESVAVDPLEELRLRKEREAREKRQQEEAIRQVCGHCGAPQFLFLSVLVFPCCHSDWERHVCLCACVPIPAGMEGETQGGGDQRGQATLPGETACATGGGVVIPPLVNWGSANSRRRCTHSPIQSIRSCGATLTLHRHI